MTDFPEWFVNLFLDIHNELGEEDNLKKFKKAGTATLIAASEPDLHIKGYAIIGVIDPNDVTIIGKRTELKDEEHTEFLKHTICLPKTK